MGGLWDWHRESTYNKENDMEKNVKTDISLVIQIKLSQDYIDMLEVPEVMEKVRFDIARGLIINPKDVWIKEVLNHYDIALQDNLAES